MLIDRIVFCLYSGLNGKEIGRKGVIFSPTKRPSSAFPYRKTPTGGALFMNGRTFETLVHRYTEKANYHMLESIFGDKKYRKFNWKKMLVYDKLLTEVINLYWEEYAKRRRASA